MKILDLVSKISVIVMMLLLAIGVSSLLSIDKKSTNFYSYENGKINLKLVKSIKLRVDYIITYKEDSEKDIFRKYTTSLDESEIQNIHTFLENASQSDYYNVEIVSYMLFDEKRLELFHSPRYLKLPSSYKVNKELLSTLQEYGVDDFQYKNLLKIEDKIYTDRTSFYKDVISFAKLKESQWLRNNIIRLGVDSKTAEFLENVDFKESEKLIGEKEIKESMSHLLDAYKSYEAIE